MPWPNGPGGRSTRSRSGTRSRGRSIHVVDRLHSWSRLVQAAFLDSTYMGGQADLIAAILSEPGLEAWPVSATDRVAFDSDEVNGT